MIKYDSHRHIFLFEKNNVKESLDFIYDDTYNDGSSFQLQAVPDYRLCKLYKSDINLNYPCSITVRTETKAIVVPFYLLFHTPEDNIELSQMNRLYLFYGCYELINEYINDNKNTQFRDIHNDEIDKGWCFMFYRNYTIDKNKDYKRLKNSLSYYGFYTKEKSNCLTDKNSKSLNVSLISPYLVNNNYIKDYVEKYIYENDNIERFRLSYQVWELLMDDVVIENYLRNISDCKNGLLNTRAEFQPSTEIQRMNIILSNVGMNNVPNFAAACKDLLDIVKPRHKSTTFPDVLYQIRNTIAHRYRIFKSNMTDEIKDKFSLVCDYFELFNLELITKYNKNSKIDIDKLYNDLDNQYKALNT